MTVVNEEGLQSLRTTLEADGYLVDVEEAGERVGVRISAGPEACPDCLAPEPVLRGVIHQLLEVPEQSIDLSYPSET